MYFFRGASEPKKDESDQNKDTTRDKVVIKEGILLKEGSWVRSWKERWFVLTNDAVLTYYNEQSSETFLGQIDLSSLESMSQLNSPEGENSEEQVLFDLVLPSRTWHFKAKSETEVHEWFQAIQIAQQYNLNSSEDLQTILSETKPPVEPVATSILFQDSNFEPERNCEGENVAKRTLQTNTLIKYFQWKSKQLEATYSRTLRDLSQFSDGVFLLQLLLKRKEEKKINRRSSEAKSGSSDEEGSGEEVEHSSKNSYHLSPRSIVEKIQNLNFVVRNLSEMRPSTYKPLPTLATQSIANGNAKTTLDLLWLFFFVMYVEPLKYNGSKSVQAVFRWFLERANQGNGGEIREEELNSFSETFVEGRMLWSVVNSFSAPDNSFSFSNNRRMNLGGVLQIVEEKFGIPKLFDAEELLLSPTESNSMFIYLVSFYEGMNNKL